MTLEVIAAGPMVTVQDLGRHGLRHQGVSAAGPMDAPAHRLANALVGNADGAALLEFAGVGGRFRATRALRFAVTGGAVPVTVEGRPLPAGESHRLAPGEVLAIGALNGATWGYLALSGGLAVPLVLGSRATHLRSGLGGWQGRRLAPGDRLPLGPEVEGPCLRPARSWPREEGPIRIVLGPQEEAFAPEIRARLTEPFTVTPQRDRMAMVLGGTELPAISHDIVSDGTVPGSIQVPGSGRPLILMAESQTTGGYPKIATVISADLPRLAQMPTGATLRFRPVTRDAAEEAWIAHRAEVAAGIASLTPRGDATDSRWLLSCDLVGGIWPPEAVVP